MLPLAGTVKQTQSALSMNVGSTKFVSQIFLFAKENNTPARFAARASTVRTNGGGRLSPPNKKRGFAIYRHVHALPAHGTKPFDSNDFPSLRRRAVKQNRGGSTAGRSMRPASEWP